MGAIAMRFGTVRPLIDTGRERISAAREGLDWVTLTWGAPQNGDQLVCAHASSACADFNRPARAPHSGSGTPPV
ncbi:hypothetical protein JCM4814A_75610 [Streptomyces phaeofaciens JCM 4814]